MITINEFLEFSKDRFDIHLSYHQIWRLVERNRSELETKKIIAPSVNKVFNEKIKIIDKEGLAEFLEIELKRRTRSIRAFIKTTKIDLSHSTVYSYIQKNKQSLIDSNVISILKKSHNVCLVIEDFKELEKAFLAKAKTA